MTEPRATYDTETLPEIKPCPYCHDAENFHLASPIGQLCYVVCKTCGACGPTSRSKADAILLHNAAADALEAAKAEISRLTHMLDKSPEIIARQTEAIAEAIAERDEAKKLLKHAANLLVERDEARAYAIRYRRALEEIHERGKEASMAHMGVIVCTDWYMHKAAEGLGVGASQKCSVCGGYGKVFVEFTGRPCAACRGTGKVTK